MYKQKINTITMTVFFLKTTFLKKTLSNVYSEYIGYNRNKANFYVFFK